MANSQMYSIGKSLIRPTWPGRQVTQSTSQTKLSFGICGKGITEKNSKMILLKTIIRTKINYGSSLMNTFLHSGKFAGLYLQTKNIDITYMSSLELISWACKRTRKPRTMDLILTNSILMMPRTTGILSLK